MELNKLKREHNIHINFKLFAGEGIRAVFWSVTKEEIEYRELIKLIGSRP